MKTLFFWMEGCPHCVKIKEELKSVNGSDKFVSIEKQNVSDVHRNKFGVRSYPTILFLTDDNAVLGKLVGFHKAADIKNAVLGHESVDKILKLKNKL